MDVSHTADLCEEVARMYGYDNLPSTIMADELPTQRTNLALEREHYVRDVLAAAGLNEAITYSLTSRTSAAKLHPSMLESDAFLHLANPLSPEREYMRRDILPTLLESAAVNIRERGMTRLFEVGHVYHRRAEAILPAEPLRVALVIAGKRQAAAWNAASTDTTDFYDIKGIVELLCERLQIANPSIAAVTHEHLQPGRSADLILTVGKESHVVGSFGELHPDARERFDIPTMRVAVAELNLELLLAHASVPRYTSISRYPAASQDLAFIAPVAVSAQAIEASIQKYAGNALSALELFDVYTGANLGDGVRSLAFRITLRSTERTLTDEEVTKLRAKIIRGVEHENGAKIRS